MNIRGIHLMGSELEEFGKLSHKIREVRFDELNM